MYFPGLVTTVFALAAYFDIFVSVFSTVQKEGNREENSCEKQ